MNLDEFISYATHPALGLTLRVTVVALLLQLLIGIPIGLYLAGKRSILRQFVEVVITLPMIFPPMALGFFLLLLLGKNGLVGNRLMVYFQFKIIFTYWGLLVAVFTVGLPFMVRSVQSARQQMPESLVEAAETLGKSRKSIIYHVIVPNIRGGIVSGLLLAFGRSIGEVGISLMLGGNIIGRTETLSLAIYNAVFDGDFQRATVFSILLSIMAVFVLFILNKIQKTDKNCFEEQ